jgi:arylsulfatase A-like enzyme
VTLDPRLGFAQGFDEYDTSMFKLQPGNVGRLLAWVRAHRDAPFFLFWHTFEVHAPYLHATFVGEVLPRPLASAVRRSTRPFSRLDPTHEIPPRDLAGDLASLGAMRREVCEALYVGGIHAMDGWIGELVRVLRESAMYDRTLIVLTSDHGEEFADHSPDQIYNKHGRTLYEELLRVPLVVKLADRRAAGTRVREVSRAIDMLPTVLQAVGLPGSADMEGRPLQPLWEDPPEGRVPRVAFAEGTILRREEGGPDGPLQVHRLDRAGGGRALRAVPPAGDAGASRAVRPAGGSG